DKKTGMEQWRVYLEGNPTALGLDENYLYIGTRGGDIFKIKKDTGDPAPLPNRFTPPPADTANPAKSQALKNRINAIVVGGGTLWAHWWYTSKPDTHINAFPNVLENNRIIKLSTASMTGTSMHLPNTQHNELTKNPNQGGSDGYPGIRSMWTDGSNVYAVGTHRQSGVGGGEGSVDDSAIFVWGIGAAPDGTGTLQPTNTKPFGYQF